MKSEEQVREMRDKIQNALDESGVFPNNLNDLAPWQQKVYIRRIAALDYLNDVLEEESIFREEY